MWQWRREQRTAPRREGRRKSGAENEWQLLKWPRPLSEPLGEFPSEGCIDVKDPNKFCGSSTKLFVKNCARAHY